MVLLLLLPFRAVERTEHRRPAGPESGPCLSVASLGRVSRWPRSTGHRCGEAVPDRVRRYGFAYFCQDKSRTRVSAEALLLLCLIQQHQVQKRFGRCAPESLLTGQKGPKPPRLTQADPALPDRSPVLLGQ